MSGNAAEPSPRIQVRASGGTILTLQALRALAALMVVVQHTSSMWWGEVVGGAPPILFNGYNGVDLFFVISGFIMPLSVRRRGSGSSDARQFLARRLERIVPLYWLCTTVKVIWVSLLPSTSVHGLGSGWHVVASYLFLPSRNSLNEAVPVLPQGWTLELEMLFYLLIAAALWFRVRLRVLLPLVLIALALLPRLASGGYLAERPQHLPLLLEFLLGLALAARWRSRRVGNARPLPVPIAATAGAVSLALLLFSPWASTTPFWFAGIFAAVVVGAALELEEVIGSSIPPFLLLLGDASYSIYLTHWFLVTPVRQLFHRANVAGLRTFVYPMSLMLLLSIGAGLLCYRYIEEPINRFFRVRRKTAIG